jgi:alanine racemase
VVKANAYGHGAAPVARACEEAGATMLACADIEEGVALRDAGVTRPILVFGAQSVSDLAGVFTHRLTPTVSTPGAAKALQAEPPRAGVTVTCHLKIDTGMNRLGFRHDNLRRTLPDVLGSANLQFESVYTHFATADQPESAAFEEQRVRFDRACAALGAMFLAQCQPPRGEFRGAPARQPHVVRRRATRPADLRCGAAAIVAANLELRPALSLHSRIVAVKGMRAGEGTGYGFGPRTTSRGRLRSCLQATPTGWTRAPAAAPACSSAAAAWRSSARCAWT